MVGELMSLADSLGDSILSVGLVLAALTAKFGTGELTEVVRLADRIIANPGEDMAQGAIIFGSPLTFATMQRAAARMCGGAPGWRDDVDSAVAMSSEIEPGLRAALLLYIYGIGVANGVLRPNDAMLSASESNLRAAEERADEFALASARFLRGLILAQLDEPQRAEGLEVLAQSLKTALHNRINQAAVRQLNVERAKEQARTGDLDGAITLLRDTAEQQTTMGFRGAASTALVETLLQRGQPADVDEAAAAVEKLAAVPTEPAFVLFDVALLRLRALVARARGDEASYRDFADRYRAMATSFGFEGHMALAQAM
jgi:adenylate cyclase